MHDLWHYLTAPIYEMPMWGPFSIAYLVIFAVGWLVSLDLYNDFGRLVRKRTNRIVTAMLQRFGGLGLIVFSIGLFFFAMRYLGITALSLHMRLWLYLSALGVLALAGYIIYYVRTAYPAQVRAHERALLKQRYIKPTVAGPGAERTRRQKGRKQKKTARGRA